MILDIDPRVDIVFKKLFGSPDHPAVTRSFVNGILEAAGFSRAVDLHIENPFRLADFRGNKSSELDILYTDETGKEIQLEMQIESHAGLARRMIHNWSQLYIGQLKQGQNYIDHRPVVSIWILNQDTFKTDHWLQVFSFNCSKSGVTLHGDAVILTVELPVWAKHSGIDIKSGIDRKEVPVPDAATQSSELSGSPQRAILDSVDRWNWFLTTARGQEIGELTRSLPDPVFKEAVNIMKDFSRQRALRHAYDMRRNQEFIIASYKRTGYDEGLEAGKADGKIAGRAEGRAEDARRMIEYGIALDAVASITGIALEDLQKIASGQPAG
jgi:hypothetical protein